MPEILKDKEGNTNWSALFMGFAVALVLIMQQYQTMHIADIKTQGEINKINFMEKDEIDAIQKDLVTRIAYVELHTMPKDTVAQILGTIDKRLSNLEAEAIKHDEEIEKITGDK